MKKQGKQSITRREMLTRLTAIGLTVPAATALIAAHGRRASAADPIRISFANVFEKGELFVQLGNGIENAAKLMGYDFRRYNNEFDSEKTLANARLMVQDRPDLILEYNGVEGIGQALRRIFDDAEIPSSRSTSPSPAGTGSTS